MNPFEMVIGIVLIVTIGSIIRSALFGRHRRGLDVPEPMGDDAETRALRDEVKALKERVAVLERIATDKTSLLEQEFERLRDQR